MFLQEIFDQLTYGEFSQLSMGGTESGVIDESNHLRILAHINLGLTDLYKRFSLKEGRVVLQLVSGRIEYPITSQFALANNKSKETTRYLIDSTAIPFKDDILKIEQILTDSDYEMSLNNLGDKYSIFTPSATTIRVHTDIVEYSMELSDDLRTKKLKLIYRANHPKLIKGLSFFDPTRIQVQLPDSYLYALLLFIASRVHNPIGMVNEFNAGNNYAMKYEAECAKLIEQNLQIDRGGGDTHRFQTRGWV